MITAMLRHPGGVFKFITSVMAGSFIAALFSQSFTVTVPGMATGVTVSDLQCAALLGMLGLTLAQRLLQFVETANIGKGKK